MIAEATTSRGRLRAKPRVCLLDDDANSALSTSAVLSEAGYEIECHCDGHKALQRLREEPADLILLDLQMPVMDGWEFRVAQRADDAIADIPVVIMTGDASAKAAAIHANSSLMKPFGVSELLTTVERVLVEHEHRKLIESVEQTGRLAVFGAIASSVGHEVNNPLSSAFATLDLIEQSMPACISDLGELEAPERTVKEHEAIERLGQRFAVLDQQVRDGQRALKRVQMVVRNLQNLCLRADDVRRRVDVHHVINQAIAMIVHELDSRALLTRSLGQVEAIWGNEAKLIQVTAHLLTKAAQTILPGQVRDNSIHVATRQERGHVVIEIADSGNGLSAESLTRVFEPAAACEGDSLPPGLGLGLPLCRDIIEAHDGQLEVHTQRGCGSRFVVRLPCVNFEDSPVTSRMPPSPSQPAVRSSAQESVARPRVWIVDDEIVLAGAIGRLLQSKYEVTVTNGPHDVLLRLATGETFDVMVCDVMMPEMTGVELADRIETHWPQLAPRIVFMSGGALSPSLSTVATADDRLFIAKPFLSSELHEIVARAAMAASAS
jgi:CheY-like chemotaxis protein